MALLSRTSKKRRWAVALALLGAFAVFAKMSNTNPPTNSAHTSPNDPDLYTNNYETLPELAAPDIEKFHLSCYGRSWKFVAQHRVAPDEIQLVFHVPVVVFTDVLTVSLKQIDNETTEVNIESHSLVGKGDFGENRRHVRQMIAAIDENFGGI